MAIKVRGVEVRPEEINLEVDFQDLTAEGQRRLFLENKEKFIQDVLQSKYSAVREVIWEVRNECSSEMLNAAVVGYNKTRESETHILDLLNVPGFQLDKKVRELLGTYGVSLSIKLWVARDENTSLELLKRMLCDAVHRFNAYNEVELLDAIVLNPKFDFGDETFRFSRQTVTRVRERIEFLKK